MGREAGTTAQPSSRRAPRTIACTRRSGGALRDPFHVKRIAIPPDSHAQRGCGSGAVPIKDEPFAGVGSLGLPCTGRWLGVVVPGPLARGFMHGRWIGLIVPGPMLEARQQRLFLWLTRTAPWSVERGAGIGRSAVPDSFWAGLRSPVYPLGLSRAGLGRPPGVQPARRTGARPTADCVLAAAGLLPAAPARARVLPARRFGPSAGARSRGIAASSGPAPSSLGLSNRGPSRRFSRVSAAR